MATSETEISKLATTSTTSAYPQVRGADLQPRAHVQEVRHPLRLQDDVDGHAAPRRGVQQVLEDLQVSQEVHDDGHHLEKEEQAAMGHFI